MTTNQTEKIDNDFNIDETIDNLLKQNDVYRKMEYEHVYNCIVKEIKELCFNKSRINELLTRDITSIKYLSGYSLTRIDISINIKYIDTFQIMDIVNKINNNMDNFSVRLNVVNRDDNKVVFDVYIKLSDEHIQKLKNIKS